MRRLERQVRSSRAASSAIHRAWRSIARRNRTCVLRVHKRLFPTWVLNSGRGERRYCHRRGYRPSDQTTRLSQSLIAPTAALALVGWAQEVLAPRSRKMSKSGAGVIAFERKSAMNRLRSTSWTPTEAECRKIAADAASTSIRRTCRRLAFVDDAGIYVINVDGTGLRLLAPDLQLCCDLDWSPDSPASPSRAGAGNPRAERQRRGRPTARGDASSPRGHPTDADHSQGTPAEAAATTCSL